MTKHLLALLAMAGPGALHAQAFPQWGSLEPGRYDVGVRVIDARDHSRSYWPKRDWRGVAREGEPGRPMQIVLWYPVARGSRTPPMPFGGYVDLWAGELGGRSESLESDRIASYRRGPMGPGFRGGMPDSAWARLLATPTAARRDAPPAPGSFPLLIQAGIGGASAQSVMLEYLASHGYVVASTPLLNTSPAWHDRGQWTPAAFDESVHDIGFVLAEARRLPFVDGGRSAVLGMGAHAGLLFQMRTGLLDAVALLDVSLHPAMRQLPYYNPRAVRIPVLDLPNNQYPGRDESLLDSLVYADRYLVRVRELPHSEFYQFAQISRPSRNRESPRYETISRYTLAFLDATLKRDTAAGRYLTAAAEANGLPAGALTTEHRAARPAVPTEEEFLTMVRYQGIEQAIAVYREVTARDPGARMFSIDGLRTASFFLGMDRGAAQSRAGMLLLAEAYPDSAKAQQHLGDLYARAQEKEEARRSYEAALAKLPGDTSLTADERRRLESGVREALERLSR